MSALRELLVSFSFDIDLKPLEQLEAGLDRIKSLAESVGAQFDILNSKANIKLPELPAPVAPVAHVETELKKTSAVVERGAKKTTEIQGREAKKAKEKVVQELGATQKAFSSFFVWLAGAAAIGAFKNLLETQIAYYGHLSDLTDKLGVSSEELQKFAYAAKLSGVELDSAALALQFLNKNLSTKGAASVFAGLKVQTKEANGQLRPTAAILGDVGEAINKLPDAAKQTAAAMALFGRSGASLLPFFKQGKQGIQGLYDKFDDLGLLVDGEVVTQIDDLGDSIDEVKTQFLSLGTDLLIGIMPYLKQLVSWVSKTVKHFKKFNQESGFLNGALKVLGAVGIGLAVFKFIKLADSLALAGAEASTLRNIFALGTWGLAIAAAVGLGVAFQDLWVYLEGGDSVLGRFLDDSLGLEESKKVAENLRGEWKGIKEELEKAYGSVKDISKELETLFHLDKPVWLEALRFEVNQLSGLLKMISAVLKEINGLIGALSRPKLENLTLGSSSKPVHEGDIGMGLGKLFGLGNLLPQTGTLSTSQGAPANVSQTNQTTINVSGSSSPKEVAKEVSSRLNEVNSSSLQDAYYSVAR